MKNIFTILVSGAVLSSVLFLSGCTKDDETPPKLTVAGDNPMTIYLNAPFNDPGVTAEDNEDGTISVTSNVSSTNPDVNKVNTYFIDYIVTDNAGNRSTFTRTVIVRNNAESLSGEYYVTGSCATDWIDGIIFSTTVNNRVSFTAFGRYANALGKLSADIDFTTSNVSIVPATIFCGTVPANRSFSGGGAISFGRDTISLNVVEITPTDTTNCSYIYVRQP